VVDDQRRKLIALMGSSALPTGSTPMESVATVGAVPSLDSLIKQSVPGTPAIAFVGGYRQLGDGGGGEFYWDPSSLAMPDGGAIVAPSAAGISSRGRWSRIVDSVAVSIRWWGASETEVDNATYINAAIAYVASRGGGEVQGLGQFRTASAIKLPDLVTLRGLGRMGLKLIPAGRFNCIEVHGASYGSWGNERSVRGVEIDGTKLIGNGLDIRHCGLRCYFADMLIQNCRGIGLRIEGSFDHKYERIECRANTGFGVEVFEKQKVIDGVYEEVSRLRFDHVDAVNNNSAGVQWNQAGGDNCEWIGCKASEGKVGIDFSRNGCKHTLMDIHCDGNGRDTAIIRINAPWAQDITIISVRGWRTKTRVMVLDGRNISVREASDIAPVADGVDVYVAANASGDVHVGRNVGYLDSRAQPHTYPEDAQRSWRPTFGEDDNALGNGKMDARYVQNGHVVSFFIRISIGSTTTLGSHTLSLSLPTPQAQDALGAVAYRRAAGTKISGIVTIQNQRISFPDEVQGFSAAKQLTWTEGDLLEVSGTYFVP
jgi:hypothetical protein